jgi:hypothetical protein
VAELLECEPATVRGARTLEKYEDVAAVARRQGGEDEGHDADPDVSQPYCIKVEIKS